MHVYPYEGLCMWGQVPTDAEHWISWSCSYRQLWVAQSGCWDPNLGPPPPTRAAHSLIHFPALQYIFIMVIISQEWNAFLEASGYVQRCFGMSQERRSTVFTVVLSKFNIRSALATEKTQCRIWWCTPVISPLEGLKQECHKFKPAWTT